MKRVGVFKFASCDGCQLTLLSVTGSLLTLFERIELISFDELLSPASEKGTVGPFDLVLVEGSISAARDVPRIKQIRNSTQFLLAIGACATAGGIQALRNTRPHRECLEVVYATPEYIDSLQSSSPISDYVHVDMELQGCPISSEQLSSFLAAFLDERRPVVPRSSVCHECKRRGTVCLLVSKQIPCLGPITQAGCNALCPSFQRGCFGCYGLKETPNEAALRARFRRDHQHGAEMIYTLPRE